MHERQVSRDAPFRILVVDDHPMLRRGLREVIDAEPDMQVVAEAADGEEALRLVQLLRPSQLDLVLMDITMPGLDGLATTKRLLEEDPGLPVVMFTGSLLERDLIAAVQAGAVGFLNKTLAPASVVRALRDFYQQGALPMPRTLAARVMAHFRDSGGRPEEPAADGPGPAFVLTAREREVLALIGRGARDREMAEHFVLTESTIKKHVQNILRKLGARNRTEAVTRFRESQGG